MAPPPNDDAPPDLDDASPDPDDETRPSDRLDNVLAPRLTDRQRATRLGALIGTVLLTFVLLCALAPDVRLSVQRAFIAPTAAPTSTLVAGGDALWFTPPAPGETFELDGHALTTLPLAGDPHPFHLRRGVHQVAWEAAPFQPQHCLLTVPRSPEDTCPTTAALEPATLPAGRIFNDSESLSTLSDTLRLALTAAINAALAKTYDATVQPGEYYRTLSANAFSPVFNPARLPLIASLRFVEEPGWSEPCAVSSIVACRAQGQDCEQLCTLASTATGGRARAALRSSTGWWYVGLTAGVLWTYTTADGHVVEQGAPDASFNFTLLVLHITWDGANWHVTPVLGEMPSLPATQDVTCSALVNDLDAWVEQDAVDPFVDVRTGVHYASDGNPADGCVGIVTATSASIAGAPTPVAGIPPLLLHRFGVLLAANAAAHAIWPRLALADPAEAALAARMATT